MFDKAQEAVRNFNETFGLPIAKTPTVLSEDRVKLRAKWIREEVTELINAKDIVEQADAAIDIIYFTLGIFVEIGIDGSKIFSLVHKANMTKIGPDNSPKYDGEGKVLKPEAWISPKEMIYKLLNDHENKPF